MASFAVLLAKELRGAVRTHRVLIVLAVFFILGLGTPLLLRYIDALLPGGDAGIVMPEFAAADVAGEFIDSVGQIGLVMVILVGMGAVARERESGTAVMTLSKPVGPGPFILAKLAALALIFAAGIVVGAGGAYLYIGILFEGLDGGGYAAATLLAALYLLLCLAVTVMWSCFFKSQLAAGGLALLTVVVLTATASLPGVGDYLPGALLSWAAREAAGGGPDLWGSLAVSCAIIAAAIAVGWQVFRRKEL